MKKYLLREVKKTGIESTDDIFVGCTRDSDQDAFTRCVFGDRKEAMEELRNNEAFNTSHIINNYFSDHYEVTEFFVTFAEVGEYDNPVDSGMIIAYSDMPDMLDEACFADDPQGI